ncbi:hypothetical protein V6Z11_D06G153500 [Gossypium hirsutum]
MVGKQMSLRSEGIALRKLLQGTIQIILKKTEYRQSVVA